MPKKSSKCLIRDYEESDIPLIAEIEFDTETKHFVGVPQGTKEEWIERASLDRLNGWAVVALPENKVAGRVCLSKAKNRTSGVVELEIIIAKEFWRRRLGREVASIMIPAAFKEMNAISIRAEVHQKNKASLALLNNFYFEYKHEAEKKPFLLFELDQKSARV